MAACGFDETLDRLSRSGEAVFAVDGGNRIILWNKACEAAVGVPARHTLGRRCDEVLHGRDRRGNVYCHLSCPVAQQARSGRDPVHRFELQVCADGGPRRRMATAMFAVASYHEALTAVVHVFRPIASPEGGTDGEAADLESLTELGRETPALTARETEILRCLAEGQSTASIARSLSIARVTVRNHVQSILTKLDVHSKLEAVVAAHRLQLVEGRES